MENLRAITLMVLAMAAFAIEDAFIKLASATLPTGQIILMLGLGGAIIFAGLARAQGARVWTRQVWHYAVLGRSLSEMLGALGFMKALALIPLSTMSAIMQAAPLAVTCGAALFLGEKVGWRRWSAIGAGFAGVMLVIRPGLDGFEPAALWAVMGVVALSARDLFTRRLPAAVSSPQVAAWAFAALVPLGVAMVLAGDPVMPDGLALLWMGSAMAIGVLAYLALIGATRLGEISVVTPFRYSRMIFALAIGIAVFGERPDLGTLAGSAIIIASGLYTVLREQRLRRRAARA